MDIITKTLKIHSTNKFVIPKQIIEKLGITHKKGTGTDGSYSVIVPSQILVHHDFSIGDKVRWSLWLDDDDIVREVLIEYLPVGSVC